MRSSVSLRSVSAHACFVLLTLLVAGCGESAQDVAPAPMSDPVLRERITVSGVSSGAYMAVQAHVALADRISGVASIAGGPYHCAAGSVQTALGPCMKGEGLDVEQSLSFAREAAAAGAIAGLEVLADSRVWVFHSPVDDVVSPAASDALIAFYADFVDESAIASVNSVSSAHGFPTLASGVQCDEMGGDYLNACEYDAAGALLRHLHPDIADRADAGSIAGLRTVDLSRYFAAASNVAADGFAYVPTSCDAGDCRLHIVFHGCRQGAEFVADRFATNAGYNEWAEANDIIVVYPQIEKSMFNPQGCWDWWGYTDNAYDTRNGKQVTGVAGLIDAFLAGTLLAE